MRDQDAGAWAYEVQALGLNYRMPDVLCALGLSQLGKLESFIARRQELAARYARDLEDVGGIDLPPTAANTTRGWCLRRAACEPPLPQIVWTASRAISIPLYPALADGDVDRVVATIRAAAADLL